jgi:hypothetical protein
MYCLKACDKCGDGKKIGHVMSVDTKNITQNWGHHAKCDICSKEEYELVFNVEPLGVQGDIVTVKIEGIMRKD